MPTGFRSTVLRLLKWAAIVLVVVLLLPYLLAPFYRLVDPVSTLMLWRRMTFARVERTWAPLATISPALPRAVMVAEDARFCTHRGVDFGELRNATHRDVDDLRARLRYDFFQRELAEEAKFRTDLYKGLGDAMKSLRR